MCVYACMQVCFWPLNVLPISLTWCNEHHFPKYCIYAFFFCRHPHTKRYQQSSSSRLLWRLCVCPLSRGSHLWGTNQIWWPDNISIIVLMQHNTVSSTKCRKWGRGTHRETHSNNEVPEPAAVCLILGGIMHPRGTWVTFQLARRGTWHPASQGQRWDVMEYDWMWWRKMAVNSSGGGGGGVVWCGGGGAVHSLIWNDVRRLDGNAVQPADERWSVWTKSECWWTDKRCDEFKYNLIWLNKYFTATWEPAASQQRWWMANGSGGNPNHIYTKFSTIRSTPYVCVYNLYVYIYICPSFFGIFWVWKGSNYWFRV